MYSMGYTEEADDMRIRLEMRRRAQILKDHKFAISETIENGKSRWRTYLPDENGRRGRQVKKQTKEELEDYIVKFYKECGEDKGPTFKEVYQEWKTYYFNLNNLSPNTADKYATDYVRLFKDKPIENRPIRDVSETELEDFFIDMAKHTKSQRGGEGLLYRAFSKGYGYVNGVFRYAFKRKIIDVNPMVYLDRSDFRNSCKDPEEKTAETELIPDKIFDQLLKQLYKDMADDPTNFSFYAVELVAKTGLRAGEIATLKWEDVNFEEGYITICRSDKHYAIRDESGNIIGRNWIISTTKTKKKRRFPIDDEIVKSLKRIKRAQLEHGCASEWLFPHPEYGWTRSTLISSCIKNKCKQLGLPRSYGIHAFRKTLNSDMRNNNASAKLCSSMLGNSPEVNDKYYYYDNSDMDTKRNFVSEAHAKRAFA